MSDSPCTVTITMTTGLEQALATVTAYHQDRLLASGHAGDITDEHAIASCIVGMAAVVTEHGGGGGGEQLVN